MVVIFSLTSIRFFLMFCCVNQKHSADTKVNYEFLRGSHMEVRETKKIFLIFLISAYVNLCTRFLYNIQTLE